MRSLAVTVCALALLLVAPGIAPGALLNIDVLDDEYSPIDEKFQFIDIDNPNLVWDWGGPSGDTTHNHTVTQDKGLFNSGAPKKSGTFEIEASAGRYPYHCEIHGSEGMKGTVSILPSFQEIVKAKGPLPIGVRVIWANEFTETGKKFDVRYRVDHGPWVKWVKHSRKRSKPFGPNDKPVVFDPGSHSYQFSARSIKGKPSKKKRSGWSPPVEPVF